MEFVNNIENLMIDLEQIINASKLVDDLFEYKMAEEFSCLIRFNKELCSKIRSFHTIHNLLNKKLDDLHKNCISEIDSYYKKS
jgi:hypothetical protein